MNERIIYPNDDGGISIVIPTGEVSIEKVIAKAVPQGKQYQIVDVANFPTERVFRDAWELTGEAVSVNFDKAVEITKQRLRTERTPLLQAQDVAFQRALESGADTAAIVAEKQRLRDITNLADEATTLDELKAIEL